MMQTLFRQICGSVAKKHSHKTGIGLIELVVYVSILGILSVMIVAMLIQIIITYQLAAAEREVVLNGRLALAAITQTVSSAQEIYAPTSVFGSNNGQLTVITGTSTQPQHTQDYVDFWISNGSVWTRREGVATSSLTSPGVQTNQLRFVHLAQGVGREAVRVTLQLTSMVNGKLTASTTLYTTITLRGKY